MADIIIWITIGFISGSVPWAVIIGRLVSGKDIRRVGDGNAGAANAWKAGGWVPGAISLVLDTAKGTAPVYFAIWHIGNPDGPVGELSMALVAVAPIIGHAWTPFLRFRGGKALAVSMGVWIAVTNGLALILACLLLGILHLIQKNHAITVTSCLVVFLGVFLPSQMGLFLVVLWCINVIVVIWKHRSEYSDGVVLRKWVRQIKRTRS